MGDQIRVAVRVRPLSRAEQDAGHAFAWNVQSNTISATGADGSSTGQLQQQQQQRYTLDHVFGPAWTTRRIYEATTQPLLHKVISGFNSTVFAYGALCVRGRLGGAGRRRGDGG